MWNRSGSTKTHAIVIAAACLHLSGCDIGGPSEPVALDAIPGNTSTRITGSVGDGPVISAEIAVSDSQGTLLGTVESDERARFQLEVQAEEHQFPLTIVGTGGIDLVTNMPPEIAYKTVVTVPGDHQIANLNMYSTAAVSIAQELGGLSEENLVQAGQILESELNGGLHTLALMGPSQHQVDASNIAEILRASRFLNEIVRRTTEHVNALGGPKSGEEIVRSISADLSDGILDGSGRPSADSLTSALTIVLRGQVSIESMRNTLQIYGVDAADAMRSAIEQVTDGSAKPVLADLPVTEEMIVVSQIGAVAAHSIANNAELAELIDKLSVLRDGTPGSFARSILPGDASNQLNSAIDLISSGDSRVLDIVNSVSRSRRVSIIEENRPPTISGNPRTGATVGTSYDFMPGASDPDNDTLVFSVNGKPQWAEFSTSTGRLYGTPTAGDVGAYTDIVISASDGEESASLPPFSITVAANNRPPEISGSPQTSVTVGDAYDFTPVASDIDGDTLSFTINDLPVWATFSSATGRLSGIPTADNVGSVDGIVISVSDGELSANLPAFSIAVNAENGTPSISGNPPMTATVGEVYAFVPSGSDPDGDPLTYSVSSKPAWARFNASNGRLSGVPAAIDVGIYGEVVISVSDGNSTASLRPFNIEVKEGNSAPTISGSPNPLATVGETYSFQPVGLDADGDELVYTISGAPQWASFSAVDGLLSGTPSTDDVGDYRNITISVSDGSSSATLGPFSIQVVSPRLHSVTLSWTPPAFNEDGSVLANHAGYRIYWGPAANSYTNSMTLDNEGLSTFVVDGLAPGPYAFVITSLNSDGVESANSNVAELIVQ